MFLKSREEWLALFSHEKLPTQTYTAHIETGNMVQPKEQNKPETDPKEMEVYEVLDQEFKNNCHRDV